MPPTTRTAAATRREEIANGGGAEQHHANKKYAEAVADAVEECAEDTEGRRALFDGRPASCAAARAAGPPVSRTCRIGRPRRGFYDDAHAERAKVLLRRRALGGVSQAGSPERAGDETVHWREALSVPKIAFERTDPSVCRDARLADGSRYILDARSSMARKMREPSERPQLRGLQRFDEANAQGDSRRCILVGEKDLTMRCIYARRP